jgi:ribosome-binding factor A
MTRRHAAQPWRGDGGARHFPRTARVNEVLREVVAEELEELAASDPRLDLLTVTAVQCDPDLRHAKVLMASLSGPARDALSADRARLQAAVARQVRLKRTPQLSFEVDPAITHGARVEEILRSIHGPEPGPAGTGVPGDEASTQ